MRQENRKRDRDRNKVREEGETEDMLRLVLGWLVGGELGSIGATTANTRCGVPRR